MIDGDILGGLQTVGQGIIELLLAPFRMVSDTIAHTIDWFLGLFDITSNFGELIDNIVETIAKIFTFDWGSIADTWSGFSLFGDDDEAAKVEEKKANEGEKVGEVKDGAMSNTTAVLKPNGDYIETDPADFVMAMKNPGDLAGGGGNTDNSILAEIRDELRKINESPADTIIEFGDGVMEKVGSKLNSLKRMASGIGFG